jgi:hypothetical protein
LVTVLIASAAIAEPGRLKVVHTDCERTFQNPLINTPERAMLPGYASRKLTLAKKKMP